MTPRNSIRLIFALVNRVRPLHECEEGQTMTEYGMIIAVVVLVAIVVAALLSGPLDNWFSQAGQAI